MLKQTAAKQDVDRLSTVSTETEAIKPFANTFLAMRVAYFNEIDTYSYVRGLDTKQIIKGICLEPRIGDHYSNASFSYDDYWLPKDSKQILANYNEVPQNLIHTIVYSKNNRKGFIAKEILKGSYKAIGIYRLVVESESDNCS